MQRHSGSVAVVRSTVCSHDKINTVLRSGVNVCRKIGIWSVEA